MKILAVEDDFLLASALEMFIRKIGYECLGITDNSEDFLSMWKTSKPDIVLLDINIRGKLDGIQIAEAISQSNRSVPVIFITSIKNQDTFERAKNLNPFAFMLKPFDELSLQRTIELAVHKHSHNIWEDPESLVWQKDIATPESFFIKVGQKLQKIKVENIDIIQADNKHSLIISRVNHYVVRLSLSEINDKLPKDKFMRVHRSYIINLHKIDQVHLKKNTLAIGEHQIPFSAAYKELLFDKLNLLN